MSRSVVRVHAGPPTPSTRQGPGYGFGGQARESLPSKAREFCSKLTHRGLPDEAIGQASAAESAVGGLAQLARAPALQAGGHRFESDILHQDKVGE
jgi:hypothetical protein